LILLGAAQAALVLLAVGVAWRFEIPAARWLNPTIEPAHAIDQLPVAGQVAEPVNIEEGHIVVIRPAQGPRLQVVDLAPDGMMYGVDDWYEMFNAVEWIADPIVAMKE
jgi:hypothetical protein